MFVMFMFIFTLERFMIAYNEEQLERLSWGPCCSFVIAVPHCWHCTWWKLKGGKLFWLSASEDKGNYLRECRIASVFSLEPALHVPFFKSCRRSAHWINSCGILRFLPTWLMHWVTSQAGCCALFYLMLRLWLLQKRPINRLPSYVLSSRFNVCWISQEVIQNESFGMHPEFYTQEI